VHAGKQPDVLGQKNDLSESSDILPTLASDITSPVLMSLKHFDDNHVSSIIQNSFPSTKFHLNWFLKKCVVNGIEDQVINNYYLILPQASGKDHISIMIAQHLMMEYFKTLFITMILQLLSLK
jgi:hypothetical protein